MISNISDISQSQYLSPGTAYASSVYDRAAQNSIQTKVQSQSDKSNEGLTYSTQVTLSDEALQKAGLVKESKSGDRSPSNSNDTSLTDEELKDLSRLKALDREVRAHEMAHVMAGGSLVRKGASYQYEMGPNGVRYAISGEVSIDASPVEDDPAATIQKMQKVKRAALAPAEPSAQDRSVAASAAQTEATARQELAQQTAENL